MKSRPHAITNERIFLQRLLSVRRSARNLFNLPRELNLVSIISLSKILRGQNSGLIIKKRVDHFLKKGVLIQKRAPHLEFSLLLQLRAKGNKIIRNS